MHLSEVAVVDYSSKFMREIKNNCRQAEITILTALRELSRQGTKHRLYKVLAKGAAETIPQFLASPVLCEVEIIPGIRYTVQVFSSSKKEEVLGGLVHPIPLIKDRPWLAFAVKVTNTGILIANPRDLVATVEHELFHAQQEIYTAYRLLRPKYGENITGNQILDTLRKIHNLKRVWDRRGEEIKLDKKAKSLGYLSKPEELGAYSYTIYRNISNSLGPARTGQFMTVIEDFLKRPSVIKLSQIERIITEADGRLSFAKYMAHMKAESRDKRIPLEKTFYWQTILKLLKVILLQHQKEQRI